MEVLVQQIAEAVMQYGIFAGLFVWLFYKTMDKNDERESNLLSIINNYNETLNTYNDKLIEITTILDCISQRLDILDKEVTDIKEET